LPRQSASIWIGKAESSTKLRQQSAYPECRLRVECSQSHFQETGYCP